MTMTMMNVADDSHRAREERERERWEGSVTEKRVFSHGEKERSLRFGVINPHTRVHAHPSAYEHRERVEYIHTTDRVAVVCAARV